jgi:hypothetical protein
LQQWNESNKHHRRQQYGVKVMNIILNNEVKAMNIIIVNFATME